MLRHLLKMVGVRVNLPRNACVVDCTGAVSMGAIQWAGG
jgi:hypothetical protein